MAVLTDQQAVVLDIVRRQARVGSPVPTHVIKDAAARHSVHYDGVDRALRGLITLGLIRKPTRGFYLPAEDDS